MNILQIGLGSMGKRRIRNLFYNKISPNDIYGFDPDLKKCKETEDKYKIKTYSNFKKAVKEVNPDIYIISTPPNLHSKYFLFAAKMKKHFFVEATTVDKGYKELAKLLNNKFIGVPSNTWVYFPAIKKLKKIISENKIGEILSFQYHMGEYLPDWHPWDDYRKVYFAKKKTGGAREMFVFELIWISDLLNSDISKISGLVEKVSDLEMTADDIYSAVVKFKSGTIGNIAIDTLARTPFRTIRFIGSTGVLDWDFTAKEIKLFQKKNNTWKSIILIKGESEKGYYTTEDMYREEMSEFLNAIKGKSDYPYSFKQDHKMLKALFALEKSSKTGKTISL